MAVRTAVIPAAGLGTRFLPATKSQPKEMLPIVDKPTIQYIVEEAVAAGITRIVVVTSAAKPALQDHFQRNHALEAALRAAGKRDLADEVAAIADLADIVFVRQDEPRGLGHAVLQAAQEVGDESFAVLLGDDLLADGGAHLRAMIETNLASGDAVLSVRRVPGAAIASYGCVDGEPDGAELRVRRVVEKPNPDDAPSDLAIFGRYVFPPDIFPLLARTEPGRLGEIQLTDAVDLLVRQGRVRARRCPGPTYDVGNRFDMIRANLEFGLRRGDLGPLLEDYLASRHIDLVETPAPLMSAG